MEADALLPLYSSEVLLLSGRQRSQPWLSGLPCYNVLNGNVLIINGKNYSLCPYKHVCSYVQLYALCVHIKLGWYFSGQNQSLSPLEDEVERVEFFSSTLRNLFRN